MKFHNKMSAALYFIRKSKSLFIRLHLHRIIEPFTGLLLNLVYISKFSKWAKDNRDIEFNDFYSGKWDYTKRFKLYEYVFNKENLSTPIQYLEFGVAQGKSFKWMLE